MLLQCTYSISKFSFRPSIPATDWIIHLATTKLHELIKTGGEWNIKSKPIIQSFSSEQCADLLPGHTDFVQRQLILIL